MVFRKITKSICTGAEFNNFTCTCTVFHNFNLQCNNYLKLQRLIISRNYSNKTNPKRCSSEPTAIPPDNVKKVNSGSLTRVNLYQDKMVFTKSLIDKTLTYVEEISHMNDVREAQEDVMAVNNALQESSETKRQILRDLNCAQTNLYKIHEELFKSSRGTDRYVQLVQSERELLILENNLKNKFSVADENEAQLLSRLTTAINNSYQKEKIHTNFLKVWALVGTLAASIFTLIGSFIAYYNHTSKLGLFSLDIKQHFNETLKSELGPIESSLISHLDTIISQQNQLLKVKPTKVDERESWGSYFKRHTNNTYRWILRKND